MSESKVAIITGSGQGIGRSGSVVDSADLPGW